MNSLIQLAVAAVLGILAACANFLYLARQTDPPRYVAAARSLDAGERIEEDDLMAIGVPGDAERGRRVLIPYRNRSVLLGSPAARDYESGDIVFARDLVAPAEASDWEVIGPFELITVGERFKSNGGRPSDAASSIRGDSVTIAVDAAFDEQTARLLAAVSRNSTGDGAPRRRIVAVQVLPPERLRSTSNGRSGVATPPGTSVRDVVYQTISLEGIPNIPQVLLEGDLIRFVVPGAGG